MLSLNSLISFNQDALMEEAGKLGNEEISQLVTWLELKEDKPRYHAFLLLKYRSEVDNSVYSYWDVFKSKLSSENSYQRSIGLMLIAENTKWDSDDRIKDTIKEYLRLLQDDKPITVRQCIQSLSDVIQYKQELTDLIADSLMSLKMETIKETMRKLILMDSLGILIKINSQHKNPKIENYLFGILTGEILDKKSKKLIEAQF